MALYRILLPTIAALLMASSSAFAIDCQLHTAPLGATQSNWSGPCTPIAADGIIVIKHPQIGELLSNFSQIQVTIDIGQQRIAGNPHVLTADIGEDLVLLKVDYVFQPTDLPRPLDEKFAAALMEVRFDELYEDRNPMKLGGWNVPRPGKAFNCAQKPAIESQPSSFECEANLAVPVTESTEAGQLVVRHFAVQSAAPMAPSYFNQLGRIFENAANNMKARPVSESLKCEHQVVVNKNAAQVKVDYCIAASSLKKGLYDAIFKLGTVDKKPTAVILAMTMKGFTQAMIKRATTRYLDTMSAN